MAVFKHITNKRKQEIVLNEILETDWGESRYWYGKCNNMSPVDLQIAGLEKISTEIQPFFNALTLLLGPVKHHSEILKEYVFEEIRQKEFLTLPSRTNCMFLIPNDMDIQEYATNMKFDLVQNTVIEIEIIDEGNLLYADSSLLNCNGDSHESKKTIARRYWGGTTDRNINTEVLFRGQYAITRIID